MSGDCKIVTVYDPTGTIRYYKSTITRPRKSYSFSLRLIEEILPNGNHIFYTYDNEDELIEIKTTNPSNTEVYAWVRIRYVGEYSHRHECRITTSDGHNLAYHLEVSKDKSSRLLRQVENPSGLNEEIHYRSGQKTFGPLVATRLFPEERFLEVEYALHHKQSDPKYKRVHKLLSPIGTTHEFSYHLDKNHGSRTEVINALGNRTIYNFCKDNRLQTIRTKNEHQQTMRTERFCWDHDRLLSKTLINEYDKPIYSHRHEYDSNGNIKEDRFYGNLTGQNQTPLTLNTKDLPKDNGCETYSTYKHYSTDGRNLLLEEKTQDGLTTIYTYHPSYQLLLSTFICDEDQIKIRTFYEYNADNILIRETTDDGTTPDLENLIDVTERHIKHITLRNTQPFYGLPETIEEKYLDLNTNQERLLKKSTHHYDHKGLITKTDIYDATDTYLYSLTMGYDNKDRLTQVTDPKGRIATTTYDANSNITHQKDPDQAFTTQHKYDLSNRLTSTTLAQRKTQYHYNNLNHPTNIIDYQGNHTTITSDAFGNPIQTTLPQNGTIQRAFDATGNIIQETDPEGHTTHTTYNARSKPTHITYPDSTEETYIYNLDGSLKTHINRTGTPTEYTYDYLGRQTTKRTPLTEETYEYNAFHLIKMTDATGTETHLTYDQAGRKIREDITKDNTLYQSTSFTYDDQGRHNKTINHINSEEAQVLIKKFDILNRIIEDREEDQNGTLYSSTAYDCYLRGLFRSKQILRIFNKSYWSLIKKAFLAQFF